MTSPETMALDIMKDERFLKYMSTLKVTSMNHPEEDQISYMTDSEIQAVNFDDLVNAYAKEFHVSPMPASNDALLQVDDVYFFIEFKDGNMQSEIHGVKRKIFESLLILGDVLGKTISFARENVVYVLVYNEAKSAQFIERLKENHLGKNEYIPSKSQFEIMNRIGKLAKIYPDVFGLRSQFEGLYFKKVYSCNKTDFNDHFISEYLSQ